jgi:NTE family protein
MSDRTQPDPGATRTPAAEPQTRALVLGGGGARAAYEVGVLSAIADRVPNLEIPILTGVSAGAINAAYLAAHRGSFAEAVRALRARWLELVADRVYRIRPLRVGPALLRALAARAFGRRTDPATVRGLVDMQPLREFLAAIIDFSGVDQRIASGRLKAVALSATSYGSGETVTFVHGPPDAPTWRRAMRYGVRARLTLDHIMASAALPVLFPAVRLDGVFYGDGSVRQTAPLSPAIHLGARGILVVTQQSDPLQHMTPAAPRDYPTLAEVVGLLLHAVFLDALEADVERLERVNRLLARLPAAPPAEGLRPINLLVLRPSRHLGALARGSGTKLPPLLRWGVRMMGGEQAAGADFLSYLVFDPAYTDTLIELGYTDAQAGWERIERFLEATAP